MTSPKSNSHINSFTHSTKVINYLLCDTSLAQWSKSKEKSELLKSTLNDKESELHLQMQITQDIKTHLKLHNKWLNILEKELLIHEEKKKLESFAAITIQRMLRGCIVRSRYTATILKIKEFKTNNEIFTLRGQTDMCMLTLGINTVPVTVE